MNKCPSEVLLRIIENACAYPSVQVSTRLCLVSKQFHSLAYPLQFHHIRISGAEHMKKMQNVLEKALTSSTQGRKPVVKHLFICNRSREAANAMYNKHLAWKSRPGPTSEPARQRAAFWARTNRILHLAAEAVETLTLIDCDPLIPDMAPYSRQRYTTMLEAMADIAEFPRLTSLFIHDAGGREGSIIREHYPTWKCPSLPSLEKLQLSSPVYFKSNGVEPATHPILIDIHTRCKSLTHLIFEVSYRIESVELMRAICGVPQDYGLNPDGHSDSTNVSVHAESPVRMAEDCISRCVLPKGITSMILRIGGAGLNAFESNMKKFPGVKVEDRGSRPAYDVVLSDWEADVIGS